MEEPSFWEDADKATRTMQELKESEGDGRDL